MTATYARRRAQREASRERELMGETLAAYHARETAPPPTLAEIFAKNRADKTVCTRTADMFAKPRRAKKKGGRCAK